MKGVGTNAVEEMVRATASAVLVTFVVRKTIQDVRKSLDLAQKADVLV